MTPDTSTRQMRALRNTTRGIYLLLVLYCLARAITYWPGADSGDPPPSAVADLSARIPLAVWAVGWAIATVVSAAGIIRPRIPLIVGALTMSLLWTLAYTVSWLSTDSSTAYNLASSYALISGLLLLGSFIAGRAIAQIGGKP